MPIVPIAALEIGARVRISGSVEVLDVELDGPLSGRGCVHYRVDLDEEHGCGEDARWVVIGRERRSVDFVVRDSTGAVLVRVARAEIEAGYDYSSRSGFLDEPTVNELALLERFNEDPEGFIFNRKLRYAEGVLEVGEEVAVMGIVRAGVDGFARIIEAPPDGALLVTDHRRTVHAQPKIAV
jgi:hypothetical protein